MSDFEKENMIIIKYLDGNLDEAEKITFNQLIKNSEEFRKELENMEVIIASLKVSDRIRRFKEAKDFFQELDQKNYKSSNIRKSRAYWTIGAAATIAFVLIAYLFLIPSDKSTQPKELYAQYFEVFPLSESLRKSQDLPLGLSAYKGGDYEKVIFYLDKPHTTDVLDVPVSIYLANAFLITSRYEKAEDRLSQALLDTTDPLHKHYLHWYLGLTQLALGKTGEANKTLAKISQESGPFQIKAKRVLREIDLLPLEN